MNYVFIRLQNVQRLLTVILKHGATSVLSITYWVYSQIGHNGGKKTFSYLPFFPLPPAAFFATTVLDVSVGISSATFLYNTAPKLGR